MGIKENKKVEVVIRPEDISLVSQNDGLFKEHQLLYILIMHAFANTYVSKRQTNLMFPGPPV